MESKGGEEMTIQAAIQITVNATRNCHNAQIVMTNEQIEACEKLEEVFLNKGEDDEAKL